VNARMASCPSPLPKRHPNFPFLSSRERNSKTKIDPHIMGSTELVTQRPGLLCFPSADPQGNRKKLCTQLMDSAVPITRRHHMGHPQCLYVQPGRCKSLSFCWGRCQTMLGLHIMRPEAGYHHLPVFPNPSKRRKHKQMVFQ
jgi:hypothetical protein